MSKNTLSSDSGIIILYFYFTDSAVTGIWKHQERRRGGPLCPHTRGPWNPEGKGGDDQQMAQAGRPRNGPPAPAGRPGPRLRRSLPPEGQPPSRITLETRFLVPALSRRATPMPVRLFVL